MLCRASAVSLSLEELEDKMKLLASGVAEVHSMLAETDETRVVWKFCLFGYCIGRANDVIAEALQGHGAPEIFASVFSAPEK